MCTCANCQTRARWETHYQKFLKDNPGESNEQFIAGMRETDKMLVCLRQLEDFEAEARSVCYEEVL